MADLPYQSLYRRYRPQRFSEVLGQDHVVLALRNAVRTERVGHAYLFSGPRGTGKTSLARILAKALNCEHVEDGEPDGSCPSCSQIQLGSSLDVHELDAASNNGVDAMRDLVGRAALGTPGRWKVYIIDEVHMLSTAASNALLKTLEEPPAHVVFVLATTDPQKVLPTIRSRTQHFEFKLLPPELLSTLVQRINADANLQVPGEALDLVVRRGRGSARDTLSALDQVAAAGIADDEAEIIDEVVEALCERDAGRALVAVAEAANRGRDPQRIAVELLEHLRNGFLAIMSSGIVPLPDDAVVRAEDQARRLGAAGLVRAMEAVGVALSEMRDAPDPRVTFEVALVRLASPNLGIDPAALLQRIERLEQALAAGAPTHAPPLGGPGAQAGPLRGGGRPPQRDRGGAGGTDGRRQPPSPQAAGPGPGARAPGAGAAVDADGSPAPGGGGRPALGALRRPGPQAGLSDRPPAPPAQQPSGQPSPLPVAPAPETAEGGLPTRDQLVQAWGDVLLEHLPQRARSRFRSGRFVEVKDGRAVFALPNAIHRDRCEEVRNEVEAALRSHFGARVPLHLVLDDEDSASNVVVGGAPGAGPATAAVLVPNEPEGNEDEIDMSETVDGGPVQALSPTERVLQAFPGAEEVQ